jgi:hypothetical protein
MGRGDSPSPSSSHQALEPSKGHHVMEPSKGHQTLDTSIGYQVGIFLHLLPFPSLLGANSNHLGLSFRDITFDLNLDKNCSDNFPWRKKMICLNKW